ncbi:MAG: DUF7544 domain-containing protein, partial [Anaerolineales bacterium]
MDYGKLIRRAWEITWKYKFLWVFGIVMAFCRVGGGGSNFNFSNRYVPGRENFGQFFTPTNPFAQSWEKLIGSGVLWIVGGLLIVLVILFFLLGIVVLAYGRGSLIRTVDLVEKGEQVDFRRALNEGKQPFRRLVGLELLLNIPGLLVGLAVVIVLLVFAFNIFLQAGVISSYENQSGFLRTLLTVAPAFVVAICGLVCLAFLIQILVAIFEVFGSRAIVIEDYAVINGIKRGWQIFRSNLAAVIILALILFGISLGIGIVIGLPAALLIGIFAALFIGLTHLAGAAWLVFLPILLGLGLIGLLLVSVVRGVYLVFAESLWTLAYRDFTK